MSSAFSSFRGDDSDRLRGADFDCLRGGGGDRLRRGGGAGRLRGGVAGRLRSVRRLGERDRLRFRLECERLRGGLSEREPERLAPESDGERFLRWLSERGLLDAAFFLERDRESEQDPSR